MVNASPESVLADRLVISAIRLTRTLKALTRTSPLSGPQISALAIIAQSGRISAKRLARLEEVTPSAVSRLVADLEKRGLVERQSDDDDHRTKWIRATGKGMLLITEGHRNRLAPLVHAIARLPQEDRDSLSRTADLLDRLVETVSSNTRASAADET
jgi:DNA-binding MarR family transcriptional regulator